MPYQLLLLLIVFANVVPGIPPIRQSVCWSTRLSFSLFENLDITRYIYFLLCAVCRFLVAKMESKLENAVALQYILLLKIFTIEQIKIYDVT